MERRSGIATFIEMADAVSRKWAANVNGGRVTLGLIILAAIFGGIYRAASSFPGDLPQWGAISKNLATYVGICAGLWLVVSFFAALVQAWGEQSHSLRLANADLTAKQPKLTLRIEHLTVQSKSQVGADESLFILALVSVANNGYRSTATKWRMQVRASIPVPEVRLGDWRYVEEVQEVDWSVKPPEALSNRKAYDDDDHIGTMTARPIESGERPMGFFLALLPADSATQQNVRSIKVLCEDFNGNVAFASLDGDPGLDGSIYLGEKHAGQFPPYGFKELPVHPDWKDR